MRIGIKLINVLAAAFLAIPFGAVGQDSSINTFSPYSFYGVGNLAAQGPASLRSMGGIGVAFRDGVTINTLNPASYSSVGRRNFLFNFELEGQNFYEKSSDSRTSYNTFNVRDIAVAFPLAKGLGFSISVTPYSSVGYRVQQTETSDEVWANVGLVRYLYEGSGGIAQFKAGIGWELFRNFSIGAEMIYYLGNIDRTGRTEITPITGTGNYANTQVVNSLHVSKVFGSFGLQYTPLSSRKHVLTLGAAYRMGGRLGAESQRYIPSGNITGTVIGDTTTTSSIHLPQVITAGVLFNGEKYSLGVDYSYSDWGSRNDPVAADHLAYRNTHSVRLGGQYTPKRNDVRRVLNRWSYRVGFRYSNYYMRFFGQNMDEKTVTFGVGIPVKMSGLTSINVGLEYGWMGTTKSQLIRENFFRFSIGLSLFGGDYDYWFMKQKYD